MSAVARYCYFPAYTRDIHGVTVSVIMDRSGCNTHPYTVAIYNGPGTACQQIARWYYSKGWAIRRWRQIVHAEKNN